MQPAPHSTLNYAGLQEWVAAEAVPFSLDSSETFHAAVDRLVAGIGHPVEVLAFGEPMHGAEEILILGNRLFQRLVEAHGYTAIAVESSFPRSLLVDQYVAAGAGAPGATSYDAIREAGFSHGFGRLEANRELIEWMRRYNADPSHVVKVRFYGFDSPTEMVGTDSPRQLLHLALDYLAGIDGARANDRRQRIDVLLGEDAEWENPEASFDPSKSIGGSPAAAALRIESEDLISELLVRRPELLAERGRSQFAEAAHCASAARQLLNYHAALARPSPNRIADLLGLRDLMMADNLTYAAARERGRGKVLAFAHNTHVQRGPARWQLGPNALEWWPAGAHLHATLGPRYAVIGSGVGVSDANGIGQPEPGTLEAHLTAAPGPGRFIPTHRGRALAPSAVANLPTRSASPKNPTYFPLAARSFTDFDWLAVLDSTTYSRGGPPLQPVT